MITLEDYKNPFQAIFDFEDAVAKYTGATYCITTDCCTHAIEIAFRLSGYDDYVTFPAYTYLSVPMTMHKLSIPYRLTDNKWKDYYQFEGSNIWDYARYFKEGMYVAGTTQCVSFGLTKPLQIGLGGCILTDDTDMYRKASMMRYDGRDLRISPWIAQTEITVGYHYYLRPEECVKGLNILTNKDFTEQKPEFYNYPDCRQLTINPY
jgi:dTDP-4-amino-4,6-dideoxygalactose transaminase